MSMCYCLFIAFSSIAAFVISGVFGKFDFVHGVSGACPDVAAVSTSAALSELECETSCQLDLSNCLAFLFDESLSSCQLFDGVCQLPAPSPTKLVYKAWFPDAVVDLTSSGYDLVRPGEQGFDDVTTGFLVIDDVNECASKCDLNAECKHFMFSYSSTFVYSTRCILKRTSNPTTGSNTRHVNYLQVTYSKTQQYVFLGTDLVPLPKLTDSDETLSVLAASMNVEHFAGEAMLHARLARRLRSNDPPPFTARVVQQGEVVKYLHTRTQNSTRVHGDAGSELGEMVFCTRVTVDSWECRCGPGCFYLYVTVLADKPGGIFEIIIS